MGDEVDTEKRVGQSHVSADMPLPTPEYVERLEQAVRDLAQAVQHHRADMHHPSDRPCPTCGPSAKALRAVGVEPFVEHAGMDRQAATDAARRAAVPR